MKRLFIILLGCWLLLSTTLATISVRTDPVGRARLDMVWGLIILWVIICGSLMYRFRDPIRNFVLRIRLPWQIKFVLLATILALLEEVITTSMTNAAPVFGVPIGAAFITASTNFFDVVFFHSVIVLVGPFVFWALALKRYDFKPFALFLIWGITGVFAELTVIGPAAFVLFGQWIFVYGLMIFLPAYTLPPAIERGAREPKSYLYPLMIFLPLIFVPLFIWIPKVVDPHHPQIHFPR